MSVLLRRSPHLSIHGQANHPMQVTAARSRTSGGGGGPPGFNQSSGGHGAASGKVIDSCCIRPCIIVPGFCITTTKKLAFTFRVLANPDKTAVAMHVCMCSESHCCNGAVPVELEYLTGTCVL